jgi:hypothetical protein
MGIASCFGDSRIQFASILLMLFYIAAFGAIAILAAIVSWHNTTPISTKPPVIASSKGRKKRKAPTEDDGSGPATDGSS